jgi:hypothetical protein
MGQEGTDVMYIIAIKLVEDPARRPLDGKLERAIQMILTR